MFKLSEIISMAVISLYESEYIGTIYNITVDNKQKKCKYLLILNENENIPKVLNVNDIYKFGKDCILIKNKSCIDLQSNISYELDNTTNPINTYAYNLDGDKLGIINDVIIDTNYNILKFIINNSNHIDTSSVFNIGKSAVLINKHKVNISKFKPKEKIINTDKDNKVMILNNSPNSPQIQPIQPKIITDSKFLINRKLTKDITTSNGELIAKTGSKITKETIQKASLFGKLIEIARFSER